jgi:ketosteroid isomerase-like protein
MSLDTWDGDIADEVAGLRIAASGDVAFCHSLNHITDIRAGGERPDMWTRSTLGLRKIDVVIFAAWQWLNDLVSRP